MIDGAAYSELNITRLVSTIQDVRIDSIQNGIKKRKKLLIEITELNNEISDLEISLDKYKNAYNDIIVSKKLSDKKYIQLQGLEKISVIQKKYKTVKRKIARNKRDLENLILLVVSIY
jgi:seryl-tRNA synthetase